MASPLYRTLMAPSSRRRAGLPLRAAAPRRGHAPPDRRARPARRLRGRAAGRSSSAPTPDRPSAASWASWRSCTSLPGRGRVLHRLHPRGASRGRLGARRQPARGDRARDPTSLEERAAAAEACALRLRPGIPILLDDVDDAVASAYGGWPDRLYLIGRDGSVAQGEVGPFGFKAPSWRTRSRPRSRSGTVRGQSPTFAQRQRYENVRQVPPSNALRMRRLTTIQCTSSGPS